MRVTNVDPYRVQLVQLASDLRSDAVSDDEHEAGSVYKSNHHSTNTHLRLAEVEADIANQGANAALLDNDHHLFDEVQSALRRIDAGHFGECECCHEPINTARLRVVPYARYCIHCAFELESKLDSHSSLYDEVDSDEHGKSADDLDSRNTHAIRRRTDRDACDLTSSNGNITTCHPTADAEFDVAERLAHDLEPVFTSRHDDDLWDRKVRQRRKRYE